MAAANAGGGRPRPRFPTLAQLSRFASLLPSYEQALILRIQRLMEETEKAVVRDTQTCKKFYGLHFPELYRVLRNDILYVKVVRRLGSRDNLPYIKLTDVLTPALRKDLVRAANSSRGVDITKEEMSIILRLCDNVHSMWHKVGYLNNWMHKNVPRLAPNLTALVGREAGVRIIIEIGAMVNRANKLLAGVLYETTINKERDANSAPKANDKDKAKSAQVAVVAESSEKQADEGGEGPSKKAATDKKEGAKPKEEGDDTDSDDDSVKSDGAAAGQSSENEADNEASDSEAEQARAKGARKAHKKN